jgi:hypothetical protein
MILLTALPSATGRQASVAKPSQQLTEKPKPQCGGNGTQRGKTRGTTQGGDHYATNANFFRRACKFTHE